MVEDHFLISINLRLAAVRWKRKLEDCRFIRLSLGYTCIWIKCSKIYNCIYWYDFLFSFLQENLEVNYFVLLVTLFWMVACFISLDNAHWSCPLFCIQTKTLPMSHIRYLAIHGRNMGGIYSNKNEKVTL